MKNKQESAAIVSSEGGSVAVCSDECSEGGQNEDGGDPMTTLANLERGHTIVKRSGAIVPFRFERIMSAIESAFRDIKKVPHPQPLPEDLKKTIENITQLVVVEAIARAESGAVLTVEGIQDIVEVKLMQSNEHDVARGYILYRRQRTQIRQDSIRNLKILRRDKITYARFNPMKIASSLERAFRQTLDIKGPTPEAVIESINQISARIIDFAIVSREGKVLDVGMIQDEIERQLMVAGHYNVAKNYILYRSKREIERADEEIRPLEAEAVEAEESQAAHVATVIGKDGRSYKLNQSHFRKRIAFACQGLKLVSADEIVAEAAVNFYEGMQEHEIDVAALMTARSKVEKEPAYSFVAARLLLDTLYRESMGVEASNSKIKEVHKRYFKEYLKHGVSLKRLAPELLGFDLDRLANALDLERDLRFGYLGLQTLYDRYFILDGNRRLETPQIFWMRVAMGLCYNEGKQKEERAIEFYNVLSQFLYISGTPTLFNSGTAHPQLSSCYLSTVMDDLHHIFKVVADDAQLSKWAGGIGNDWSNVRATGALIRGTNGKSQGVIPFLKVANDTAVAVNQGGKRRGAMCAYLETWHLDIEDFIELRKNTGDERRRTHDMNTANWICDLFIKRVLENGMWTLFSPNDVPDLHDLYGKAFEQRYVEYEAMAERGEIKLFKRIEATALWRRMLGMLYETGHPWITFKDPSNIRSPQDHVGVVHSSNLCTEILLNTSEEETAVCNLGSINLPAHMTDKGINEPLLASTIRTAVRMLDNVIDINFYPTEEAKRSNLRHRPVGLGVMGFQDALYLLDISYASHEAVEFADKSQELVSYYAILASSELAKERGPYSTFKGSKWDRGLLPIDTIKLLREERGGHVEMDNTERLDWKAVRQAVARYGMRNSNTMAIAPTATIGNIVGVTQSIEPMYKHLFVKSNLSGEFTVTNTYLVEKLKSLKLWDAEMVDDLKYFDGSILEIERIPDDIKGKYLTAFEIEPEWLIECASRRQKWIDMGQSLNLYLAEPSGKKLNQMYLLAWSQGLKTTYYLRSLGATHVEKSTVDINKRGLQPRWMKSVSPSSRIVIERGEISGEVCGLDGTCESCQ